MRHPCAGMCLRRRQLMDMNYTLQYSVRVKFRKRAPARSQIGLLCMCELHRNLRAGTIVGALAVAASC